MKTEQIIATTIRDITLATVVFAFVVAAIAAAVIAADRRIAAECRVQQEYRPCR